MKKNKYDLIEQRKQASLNSKGGSDEFIYRSILSIITRHELDDAARVLDVGCGRGELLGLLKQEGVGEHHLGADLTKFSEHDFEFVEHDFNYEFGDKIEMVDLIISSEVIEHLENPRQFLRNLCSSLKPGGHLLLTTPNIESMTSLLSLTLRGYHAAFGPSNYPAHISPISEWDIRCMVNEISQLKLVEIYYLDNGRIPGTGLKWHRLFPFLKGKRFSDNFAVLIKKNEVTLTVVRTDPPTA